MSQPQTQPNPTAAADELNKTPANNAAGPQQTEAEKKAMADKTDCSMNKESDCSTKA